MTIDQLIPAITPLSQADKIRLLQVIAQQLAVKTPAPVRRDQEQNPLKGSVTFENDILSPLGDTWDADR